MKWKIALCFIILASTECMALFETAVSGVIDYTYQMMDLSMEKLLDLIVLGINQQPDFDSWPTLKKIRDGFSWISGFFILALTIQGLKYTLSAGNPTTRYMVKNEIQKLFVGMIIISINPTIYGFCLDFSQQLTNAFIEKNNMPSEKMEYLLFLGTTELMCILMPLTLLITLILASIVFARYVLTLVIGAFFPIILCMYFSQISLLKNLGSRGLNLFLICMISPPAMALLYRESMRILQISVESTDVTNPIDPILGIMMALAGFILTALTPILMFGLEKPLTAIATGGLALAGGGMALSSVIQNSMPQQNTMQKPLNDSWKRDLVNEVAGKKIKTSDKNSMSFLENICSQGLVVEDENSILQVGDAGKYLMGGKANIKGYFEGAAPYGRGYGDIKSLDEAGESETLSSGKVIMRNTLEKSMLHDGVDYDVKVSSGETGYNVYCEGGGKASFFNLKSELSSQNLLDEVAQKVEKENINPHTILRNMDKGDI